MPDGPSIITSRTSCSVSPISAIGLTGRSPPARLRTHSAPLLVLPAPRPPIKSQVVHGPPPYAQSGGR
jgi:hypothetical protein